MANAKAAVKAFDKALTEELTGCVNLSQRIRLLHAKGWKTADIQRSLERFEQANGRTSILRYQHVRNVIITPLKG